VTATQVILGVGGVCGVLALLCSVAGIHINITSSLPRGVYRVVARPDTDSDTRALARGMIVLACLPMQPAVLGRERGYLGRGNCPGHAMFIGKRVVAHSGDTVVTSELGVRVNGRWIPESRALERDRRGRSLVHAPFGVHVLGTGDVFLMGDGPWSWDSRYVGVLPTSSVRAVVRPLWVGAVPLASS
jgi:conjugative transfer signal peptidase TraF